MEYKGVIDILIIVGSLGAMMFGMLKFMLRDIHKELLDIKSASDRHEKRIDHLYEVIVEVLKTRK